jgi:hypothetical protein
MASSIQRKKHYITFQRDKPEGFPEFMGSAKLGNLQCCYFFKGRRFPRGRYEFELTTITIPAGFSLVNADGSLSAPTEAPFIMPVLLDLIPEGGQENFPYEEWHYCLGGGGDVGLQGCAKPLIRASTISTRNISAAQSQSQIVFFYDDTDYRIVPLKSRDPEVSRDPNHHYFFIPMLLPNQTICYYLLPESSENDGQIINNWNENIVQFVGTPFFIAIEKPLIFDDNLQLFFTDEVKPFWT